MFVDKEIITTRFKPLRSGDLLADVQKRMQREENYILPVVDHTTHALIGQLGYQEVEKAGKGKKVSNLELERPVKIYRGQHLFEAASLILKYERTLLPVVDDEWTLLGILERETVLEILPQLLNVTVPGSVISITLDRRDFTVSEIVQLIETEEARILGMTVENELGANGYSRLEISFKLNVEDVSRVAAALRRYDYEVSTNSENEIFSEDIQTRADELLNYIDM